MMLSRYFIPTGMLMLGLALNPNVLATGPIETPGMTVVVDAEGVQTRGYQFANRSAKPTPPPVDLGRKTAQLTETIAGALVRLDFSAVTQTLKTADDDDDLAHFADYQTLRTLAAKVCRVQETLLDSYQHDIGKRIVVPLPEGPQTVELTGTDERQLAIRKTVIIAGKESGYVEVKVPLASMPLDDQLRRLRAADSTAAGPVMAGLLALRAKATTLAQNNFRAANHPLGTLLAQQLSYGPPPAAPPPPRIAVAGTLFMDLRAHDTRASTATWTNRGTLGQCKSVGNPKFVTDVAGTGIAGVEFNGIEDAYVGPRTVPELEGASLRSIEVWAYNPEIAVEETLVLFGAPGKPGGKCAMNYGTSRQYGACAQQQKTYDVGWNHATNIPPANAWHHLAYTYDGDTTCRYYVDGELRLTKTLPGSLDIAAGKTILIGAARATANSAVPSKFWFSGYINSIRVHSSMLTPAQVATNFLAAPALSP